ncbi:DUF416 family protein [Nocardioides nitrophenolicus]|uniref:DUF416 family protein n=1 Tax=Nocardioides nitrophenolicus TaxID=60489 RepID=UPI00195D3798|nr:DUF416 family protein [Nocardioides nitrophenolicus]MBM7518652.1 hypothetical protein [Nocardioides nitrophenolicus]
MVEEVTVRIYDERDLIGRLTGLDRRSKTAFAAACAQRLLQMFERYSSSVATPEVGPRLARIVDAAWAVASGEVARTDLLSLQAEAEDMVPSDEDSWTRELGYGQNAAAAAAYAIRTWLTNDPQEAGWAARQVYEIADYAMLQANPDLDPSASGADLRILGSDLVQDALQAIEIALDAVATGSYDVQQLRADAEAGGRRLADAAP